MSYTCEICDNPVDPNKAWKKVTGWMKPTGNTIHFQTPPFSFACETCMFEKKIKKQLGRGESLF